MKNVFLFPGQGAQHSGMGKDLYEASADVRRLFDLASDVAGTDVASLVFSSSDEELKASDRAQLAITMVNLSAAAVLTERGIPCHACAGFSLGEYAALVQSGVLDAADAIRLIGIRGDLMEKASRALDSPDGNPGMAAVMGMAPDGVATAIADIDGVFVANLNSPVQTVISGTHVGLSQAEDILKEAGVRRFIRLKVSGPFHSPLLVGARDEFAAAVEGISFQDPFVGLYSNVTGKGVTKGSEAKELAVRQIVSPVRWIDEEEALVEDGYDQLFEVGPGTVLAGLWKAFSKDKEFDIACHSAGTLDKIQGLAL